MTFRTVLPIWKVKFFRLDDHIERFFYGMDKLRLSIPHNRRNLRSILVHCVRASGLREAYVEMICTRGSPKPGSRDPRECKNRLFAFAIPYQELVQTNTFRQAQIEQGAIKPVVARSFSLEEICDAQTLFLKKQHVGKIVLRI